MDITLNITDTYCTKCYKNTIEKTQTFTSIDTSLELQNNYFLNVVSVDSQTYTILIQNGDCVIIRNILFNIDTSIVIPSKCTHVITVTSVQ